MVIRSYLNIKRKTHLNVIYGKKTIERHIANMRLILSNKTTKVLRNGGHFFNFIKNVV